MGCGRAGSGVPRSKIYLNRGEDDARRAPSASGPRRAAAGPSRRLAATVFCRRRCASLVWRGHRRRDRRGRRSLSPLRRAVDHAERSRDGVAGHLERRHLGARLPSVRREQLEPPATATAASRRGCPESASARGRPTAAGPRRARPRRICGAASRSGSALSHIALLVRSSTSLAALQISGRLRWWIDHSTLDLYAVDSAGACFPDLLPGKGANGRVLACAGYEQASEPSYSAEVLAAAKRGAAPVSSSFAERLAILQKAYEASELKSRPIVLKVTGKYALPGLEEALRAVPNGTVAVVQAMHGLGHTPASWQNTELWGMRGDLLRSCVDGMPSWQLMERRAYECVTDAAFRAGFVAGSIPSRAVRRAPRCCARRLRIGQRWAVWDAVTPNACRFFEEHGECGADMPCNPKERTPTAACCTAHGCSGVYRLPPLAIPRSFGWRGATAR